MYIITRKYTFSAAHRVEGHPKCGRLHGHNYEVTVELHGDVIPLDGMLLDYGLLDQYVKPIIDEMDHRYIFSISNRTAADGYAELAVKRGDGFQLEAQSSTAENLAEYLYKAILDKLWENSVSVTREGLVISVSETTKSSATFLWEK